MRDHVARELKGHNILAVERFQDKTRWMVEFSVLRPRTAYGAPGDETRLFLDEDGYLHPFGPAAPPRPPPPARNAGTSKSNGMPASLRGISWTSSPKRNATRKPDKLRGRNEYVYR